MYKSSPPQQNKNIGSAHFGSDNGMFGKKHTPEAIAKMSVAAKKRRHSPEALAKISEAMKGKPSGNKGHKWTEEHREKARVANSGLNNPMYGKKHSLETLEKQRQDKLGKKLSVEHRQKIGASLKGKCCGENSSNWKGGITPQERKDRQLFSNTTSKLVFARDGYTCQICDEHSNYLHADHVKSWSEYPDLRFDLDNCRTLCRVCHYYVTFKKKMPSGSKWGIKSKIKECSNV